MNAIYLDHAATTPVHPAVIERMTEVLTTNFGNPSSIHSFGRKARQLLDQARSICAQSIGADDKEIIFTSGGTESDNLAILGTAFANKHKGKHIITTKIEHHATLYTIQHLEKNGYDVTYLDVGETGRIDPQDVEKNLREDTILVSIMMVNNETGIIQPIKEIGEILNHHPAYFHTDAVQAFGLLPIDVDELHVDLLSVSSHKINGPKGLGFLFARQDVSLQTLQFGGEQERKRRAGTENMAGIAGFAKAIEIMQKTREDNMKLYQRFRSLFIETLKENKITFSINGKKSDRVPNIINISFPNMNVETLLTNFDLSGVAASSGSACTAGSVEPSHVLTAMYQADHPCTTNSIRFSFGLANNTENVKEAAERVAAIIQRLS